ncbi:unnamed protein product [Parascedosporium putredinis]|uniref:Uncharacterized protein n=1 Tax=Parascedosporium putredinis TaxID=1442378 RepID=A0A9P1MA84_9PEZI|nr:unnamed protein product [Parascedosporium putredinis]CAI7993462.1 unnamed protein product [Parascedosporium putredinis]
MKFSTVVFGLATMLGAVAADPVDANGDGLLMATSPAAPTYMSNLPALMACTEANLFLCFCKSSYLPVLYKNCICNSCPGTTAQKKASLQFGLDTCTINGSPINWLGNTC